MKMLKFTLRGFKRPSEVVTPTLGELERKVMERLWQIGEVSVREVHRFFDERAAYTTVMTTLDRLYKKGLLERRKSGRAFLYSPRFSREEFERGIAEDVLDELLARNSDGTRPMLAYLVETVSERDHELLEELDQLVQRKKREMRHKE